nr:MAG TPA: hypothetical protein [Caudoviricetes sp.]
MKRQSWMILIAYVLVCITAFMTLLVMIFK